MHPFHHDSFPVPSRRSRNCKHAQTAKTHTENLRWEKKYISAASTQIPRTRKRGKAWAPRLATSLKNRETDRLRKRRLARETAAPRCLRQKPVLSRDWASPVIIQRPPLLPKTIEKTDSLQLRGRGSTSRGSTYPRFVSERATTSSSDTYNVSPTPSVSPRGP